MIKNKAIILLLLFLASCVGINKDQLLKDQSAHIYVEYSDWVVAKENDKCFIVSFPISSSGSFFDRKMHYMILSNDIVQSDIEIGIVGGGKYAGESFVRLQVGDTSFFFGVAGDQAWAKDEKFILDKFLKNEEGGLLVFSTFSKDNLKVIDKYSLAGFDKAYENLLNNCQDIKSSQDKDLKQLQDSKKAKDIKVLKEPQEQQAEEEPLV